ncbi:helix-turn-helix domain-containing protein [Burkholderia vietnamiensis]|uniref:helix-turn-helix domain-containing protein n=1 Tax=Burkholderia vietnamiensis TaxID=60552 RepID=UPI001CF3620A|nr:helix-turn-helix transcriptional regulator [Burkholderia vietnamiensis]MCA7984872.1 helix-turn-helix domain-containing protein [Burkholderia vietnamiensis]HDR9026796.1 helix-turn-helix transcriptional regulator [Burkholderia vietnamiensis]
MDTWNNRLADAFEKSGYSMNKLAKEVGVSAPTFAAWIGAANIRPAQDITANNLFKVCRLLRVRPEWVLLNQPPRGVSDEIDSSDETVKSFVTENGEALADMDRKSRVYLSSLASSACGKVPNEQLDEFIAELKAAIDKDRLTPHRFFLLRELLREGAETHGASIENQRIKTRGGHGRRASTRGKTGTRDT